MKKEKNEKRIFVEFLERWKYLLLTEDYQLLILRISIRDVNHQCMQRNNRLESEIINILW